MGGHTDNGEPSRTEDELFGAMGDIPHPVDWSVLSAIERRHELQRLGGWVVELARTWPVTRAELPPCWYRHESLIRILSAARDAYLTAFDPTQAASAAADWMHVWDATVLRLTRWVAVSGCKSAHHPDPRQRWVNDHDEGRSPRDDFEHFVQQDFRAHSERELGNAIDAAAAE